MNTKDFAKMLGVSQKHVIALIKKGTLQATQVGRDFVIAFDPKLPGETLRDKTNAVEKKFLTTGDFARRYLISQSRVLAMIKAGRLKAVQISRDWLISLEEAEGWQKVPHKTKSWLERVAKPGQPTNTTDSI